MRQSVTTVGRARGLSSAISRLSSRWLVLLTGLVVLVGVALRAIELGGRSLVFDEGYTWALAQRSFGDMLSLFTFEANGTLYPVLLWPILRIDESEAAIRSVALVFGVAAIFATYFAARVMLREQRAALFAVILISASPLAIGSSQAAKGSSLALALVTTTYGLLGLALRGDGKRWWFLYGLVVVLVAYSSSTALIALAGQPLMVMQARARLRLWAITLAVSAVALLPLLYWTFESSRQRDSLYWERQPTLGEVVRVLEQLTVGEATDTRQGRAALLVVLGSAVLLIALTLYRRPRLDRLALPAWVLPLVAWSLGPMIVLLLVSQVKPIFDIRYVGQSLPAVCILGGALLARAPSRVAAGLATALAAALTIAFVTADSTTTDYRTAGRWLSARTDGGEAVLVVPIEQLPSLAYYEPSLRGVSGAAAVEEWGDTIPPRVVGYKLPGGYGNAPTAPPPMHEIERLAAGGTFYVVSYPGQLGQRAESWLGSRCEADAAPIALLNVLRYRCPARGTGG